MRRPLSRRVLVRRTALGAALIVTLLVVVIGTRGGGPAPAKGASATTNTRPGPPVFGPTTSTPGSTRAGDPAVTPKPAIAALAAQVDPVLFNTDSCLVVRDAVGKPLYLHDAGAALAPASTQKLLIGAAALDLLGPTFRFTTTVVAARQPVGGEVDDAWLVGRGDPVLSSPAYTAYLTTQPITAGQPVTTPIAALASQLAAAGVHTILGGIHGDDSRYDRTRSLPTWKASYIRTGIVAPIGALEVDEGLDRWHPPVGTADPAGHAAGVLARLARAAGITATQGPDGVAPAGAVVLASVQSPTLADIVTSMLRNSDNTTAEMLVRELDRVGGGTGTTAGGLKILAQEVTKLGLPTAGLTLVDGSGLSPEDRVSCETLLDALDLSAQPRFAALGLLSVAGRFGTLYNRFTGTPAIDHLEAKTGNIAGVFGLVGRLDEGSPMSFAFLLNGPLAYAGGLAYEDRLVAALGTYRE